MVNKFHISLEVQDIAKSAEEYSKRLACKPEIIIENEYALWRTDTLNFSIRKGKLQGKLRHLGFEDASTTNFYEEKDINGITWERFSAEQQRDEIKNLWK
ncbi:MAG: hypothetical protein WCL30_00220 [Pseudomonadota bacterium]